MICLVLLLPLPLLLLLLLPLLLTTKVAGTVESDGPNSLLTRRSVLWRAVAVTRLGAASSTCDVPGAGVFVRQAGDGCHSTVCDAEGGSEIESERGRAGGSEQVRGLERANERG